MSKRRLGFSRERDLARLFWKRGFACLRGPASGAKTKRIIYPDLVVMKKSTIFVMEIKTRGKKEPIYIEEEKIERLIEFARRAGGIPLIAVKYMDGSKWKFIHIDNLFKTPKGNYKVDPDILAKHGLDIKALDTLASKIQKLHDFL